MYTQDSVTEVVKKFATLVSQQFPVKYCYLFGSYALGKQTESSDIDIAIVSDSFEGNRFLDREKLANYVLAVSYDIEVHPFKTEEFNSDNPLVHDILIYGVRIVP